MQQLSFDKFGESFTQSSKFAISIRKLINPRRKDGIFLEIQSELKAVQGVGGGPDGSAGSDPDLPPLTHTVQAVQLC
jgi:hypothetical protein